MPGTLRNLSSPRSCVLKLPRRAPRRQGPLDLRRPAGPARRRPARRLLLGGPPRPRPRSATPRAAVRTALRLSGSCAAYQSSDSTMAASCTDRGTGGKASDGGGPVSARPCSRPIAASSTNQWRGSPDASSATWRSMPGPSFEVQLHDRLAPPGPTARPPAPARAPGTAGRRGRPVAASAGLGRERHRAAHERPDVQVADARHVGAHAGRAHQVDPHQVRAERVAGAAGQLGEVLLDGPAVVIVRGRPAPPGGRPGRRADLAQAGGDLDRAAGVGDGHHRRAGRGDRLGLLAPQPPGQLGLQDAVEAGGAAAAPAVAELHAARRRRARSIAARLDALGVQVVAGVVHGHPSQPARRARAAPARSGRAPSPPRARRARPTPGRRPAARRRSRTWALQPEALTTTISPASSSGMRVARHAPCAASGWP